MRRLKVALTVLIILAVIFIWGNSALSREASLAVSEAVRALIGRFVTLESVSGTGGTVLVRKAAHFTEFFILGALLFWRLRLGQFGRPVLWAGLFSGAVACLDETLQLLSHRGSALRDVLIDVGGAACSIVIFGLLCSILDRMKNKKPGGRA